MNNVPPWKLIVVVGLFLMSAVAVAPTLRVGWLFKPFMGTYGETYETQKTIQLGLDLRGGLDMIFRVKSKTPDRVPEDVVKAIEILRNRLDLLGTKEISIQAQGSDQIRIQVPGVDEREQKQIKDIVKTTDLLTFKVVRSEGESNNVMALLARKGPDDEVLQQVPDKGKPAEQVPWYLVKKEPEIGGDSLRHARIGFDQLRGEPRILLEFNDEGTKKFGEITKNLVGQRLAIVLGGKVYMAPVINEPIPGGHAEIKGSFDIEEARMVTTILKAGALPAPLEKLAENTLGPSLGADSIRKGVLSSKVGFALVAAYMVVYYKTCGAFSVVALTMNVLLLMTFMLFLGSTLTMPGIAGIVLTVGMAVDANVIIFERIKEELRWGKTVRAAIDAGFDKGIVTIVDSNLTTILTGVVLYIFGSGPIRGFAVTLNIGICVSMFTAVFVTKVLLDLVYGRAKTISV